MKTKLTAVLLIFFLAFSFILISGSMDAQARSLLIRDADNKYCPVTGKEIKKKKYNTTYSGKRYWFSSYKALKKFKQDPSEYMEDRKEQKRSDTDSQGSSWF